jgi:hypothetical protein
MKGRVGGVDWREGWRCFFPGVPGDVALEYATSTCYCGSEKKRWIVQWGFHNGMGCSP